MRSRRVDPSDKRDDNDINRLESGVNNNDYCGKSASVIDKHEKGTYPMNNTTSLKTFLKTITIWGSLLCIGYRLGTADCRRESSEASKSVSHNKLVNKNSDKHGRSDSRMNPHSPTLKEMYESRNCESYLATYDSDGKRIDSNSLPIYTDEQWQQFRDLWREQGGRNAEDYYEHSDKRRSKAPPDFVPPFKAGQTRDGKGRGVFATRDIKKGEMTYGLSKNYIFFKTGDQFRQFLDALDDEKACDLMKFTWPQENIGPKGEKLIWGPMDANAFQNDGGRKDSNTGCPRGVYCGNFDEYALRDIKEGEELLCDYGEFFSLDFLEYKKWKWFGL